MLQFAVGLVGVAIGFSAGFVRQQPCAAQAVVVVVAGVGWGGSGDQVVAVQVADGGVTLCVLFLQYLGMGPVAIDHEADPAARGLSGDTVAVGVVGEAGGGSSLRGLDQAVLPVVGVGGWFMWMSLLRWVSYPSE